MHSYLFTIGTADELGDLNAWAPDHSKDPRTKMWLHKLSELPLDVAQYPRHFPVPLAIAKDLKELVADWEESCSASAEEFRSSVTSSEASGLPGLPGDEENTERFTKLTAVLEGLQQRLEQIKDGSGAAGRWLDAGGTECEQGDAGARWEPYTEDEQSQWLASVASEAAALAALVPQIRRLIWLDAGTASRWEDNAIQFPRLLAEIVATQDLNLEELASSMDLELDDVNELLDRAQNAWEAIKAVAAAPNWAEPETDAPVQPRG